MASPPFTIVLSLLLFFAGITSAAHHHRNLRTDNNNDIIQEACKASPEPPKCQASLSGKQLPPNATVSQVIQSALWISSQHLETARKMVHAILEDASTANKNRTDVASTCLQLLRYSNYRVKLARDVDVARTGGGRIKDARAWVSAALAYQYGCWSGLQKVNDTFAVVQTVDFFGSSLLASTSDALGMMLNYDIFGDKTGLWGPPKTERDGFWGNGSDSPGSGSVGGVPAGLKVNVTVCKGGNESSSSCDYRTVQEAVNAAPNNPKLGKRFVIWIKSGVYEETVRIPLRKKNVILLGDGMGKTVITGSMSVGLQGGTTYNTATVGVLGDGFMAKDLTIQNTAGANANQAVAFRSDSDLSIIQNCEFIGNQDTLYAHSLRQYYKSCRIQGNVDFIFGNSASVFQDCLILIAPRQLNPEKSETNAITAHGRIDPAESTGFVFHNCVINGTDAYMALYNSNPSVHKNFLGRPWKQYSRTVFVRCTLEALISPDGWMPWSGDFALKTLYYGEFENRGPGSNRSKRVSWSSSVPAEHVEKYSVQNFIQGDRWIPTS